MDTPLYNLYYQRLSESVICLTKTCRWFGLKLSYQPHVCNGTVVVFDWANGPQSSYQALCSSQWRHNGRDGVSNHQPHDCFLNRLFRHRSQKTSKLRVTGLCAGTSPEAGESPYQRPLTREMFPFDDVIMNGPYTVHSKDYAHGPHFVVVWFRSILPISLRVTSQALGQSSDCPGACEVTLMNKGEWITRLTKIW